MSDHRWMPQRHHWECWHCGAQTVNPLGSDQIAYTECRENSGDSVGAAGALERVTRFEVIDEDGRQYVRDHRRDPVEVTLSYQDDGRTLKVFVKSRRSSAITAEKA
jgi:hypothetical protein